jgi:hypothetical protein
MRTIPTEEPDQRMSAASDDPDVIALIDALGDKSLVRAALAMARDRGDRTVVRVVLTWLELYEQSTSAPTLRTLGEEAEISHQGAADALRRFTEYVKEADPTGP